MTKPRAIVAMSGGVDSSVAAALLVEQGYLVVGVNMCLWTIPDGAGVKGPPRCCSAVDAADARAVADALGILHHKLELRAEFERDVVAYFVAEYAHGRTPNPCIACNEHVKFRALLDLAGQLGADVLATGHYARIEKRDDGYHLLRGIDPSKDQSYVLYMLGQSELSRLLFPVGGYHKTAIRALAAERGLPVAEKPDSNEICFVPGNDYRAFLAERLPQRQGDLLDLAGRVIGRHDGVAAFTVGQRRGLGVATGEKLFVTRIDPTANTVVLGPEHALIAGELLANDLRWVAGSPPSNEFTCEVKIRYRTPAAPARVTIDGDRALARFDEPQRAITPGQAAVFYHNDEVLGGSIILSSSALIDNS